MRRGEKPPPVYAASKLGSARTLPFKRPSEDSLPKFDCGVKGCGGPTNLAALRLHLETQRKRRHFCSLGCLGRWAALQEIRQ